MDITGVIVAISRDIVEIVRAVMSSSIGINDKVHRNTLTDSDIYKGLTITATNDGDLVYDLMLNDYIKYIENGRRAGAKMPPVEPIVRWAKKHGIPTDNSTIFLIRRAIARDGISARPIMEFAFKEIGKYWDSRWADELYNKIMKEIDKWFNG